MVNTSKSSIKKEAKIEKIEGKEESTNVESLIASMRGWLHHHLPLFGILFVIFVIPLVIFKVSLIQALACCAKKALNSTCCKQHK